MNDRDKEGFRIVKGKGFRITFENGWTASVHFGPGDYCDNFDKPPGMRCLMHHGERVKDGDLKAGLDGSRTAEIMAWNEDGWKAQLPKGGNKLEGHCPPGKVLAFMQDIASLDRDTEPDEIEWPNLTEHF